MTDADGKNESYGLFGFLIDCAAILLIGILFVFIKGIFLEGGSPNNWLSFLNSVWIMGGVSAITCFPAFLLGARVLRSPGWFLSLSWLTVVAFFLVSLYWSNNLSYKIGTNYVYEQGQITVFGLFYKLSSLRTLMALWATYIFVKKIFGHKTLLFKP